MTEHADVEALSAFADGEAPEWAAHVASCAACRDQVRAFQAVRGAVGAPVPPLAPAARDAAIEAAMAALPDASEPRDDTAEGGLSRVHGGGGGRRGAGTTSARGRPRGGWLVPVASVAAVLLAVVGAATLLTRTSTSGERSTVAGPALQTPESATSSDSAGAGGAGASLVPTAGDLGDIPDAATLVTRAGPAAVAASLAAGADAKATTGPSSGRPAASAPGPTLAPASPSATPGTRACELQARSADPGLRELVFFTTARSNAVPAFVLGFATADRAHVSLFVLEQRGCALILRAST